MLSKRSWMMATAWLLLSSTALAGQNAGARAWLSWDRQGITTQRHGASADTTLLYVHLEGVQSVSALAIEVSWESGPGPDSLELISASPNSQYGWAVEGAPDSVFAGDSTFTWAIQFPGTSDSRSRVVYAVDTSAPQLPEHTHFWIELAATADQGGALDTMSVVGGADLYSEPVPVFGDSDSLAGGVVLARMCPGSVAYGGRHIVLQDMASSETANGLASLGFQSGFHVSDGLVTSADSLITTEGGLTIRIPDPTLWYVLRLADATNTDSLVAWASNVPGVCFARPVRLLRADATPNDPLWSDNWFLSSALGISATSAWDFATGSDSLVVGIVDTGIDYLHLDLDPGDRSRVLNGRDFADHDFDPDDNDGHGTSVAGLAGAEGNNSRLMAGTLWRTKLIPIKIQGDDADDAWDVTIADGIRYSAGRGAQITNISFGSPFNQYGGWHDIWNGLLGGEPLTMSSFTAYNQGTAMFAAAGNDGIAAIEVPAMLPWVCAVSGTDQTGSRSSGLNYGNELDILAPGTGGKSLGAGNYASLVNFGGTSMASPIAAAVAGLCKAYGLRNNITLSNDDLYEILRHTAIDLPPTGWDQFSGWGRMSAANALAVLKPPYTMMRGSAAPTSWAMTQDTHIRTFLDGGSLPPGQYICKQYKVRVHVAACGPFANPPMAWGRPLASRGYSAANPQIPMPWSDIENVTTTGFDVVSYVYDMIQSIPAGGYLPDWYPCRPVEALLAYTGIGVVPTSSVDVLAPQYPCAFAPATWHAQICGSDATVEWRERVGGGSWSGVVGTGPDYTRTMPNGIAVEAKATVTAGANTFEDEASATANICTVDVGSGEAALQFGIQLQDNPGRGQMLGWVTAPDAATGTVVEVFDASGRRVATPLRGQLTPGRHSWLWNGVDASGRSVGSGLYFIRAEHGRESKVIKAILLK